MTKKPVKFGTIGPELVAFAVQDKHYKSITDRILAITDALNEELHELADAGCPVIQYRGAADSSAGDRARSSTRSSIRPSASKCSTAPSKACAPRPKCGATPAGAILRSSACSRRCRATSRRWRAQQGRCRRHHLRMSVSAGGIDLEAFGKIITDKKICHRRHRSPFAAGRAAGRDRRRKSAARSSTFRPSGW